MTMEAMVMLICLLLDAESVKGLAALTLIDLSKMRSRDKNLFSVENTPK